MSTAASLPLSLVPKRTGWALLLATVTSVLVAATWGQLASQILFHIALLGMACGILLAGAGADHPDLKTLFRAFLAAYALRILVTLLWHAFSSDGLFFIDDVTYDGQATALVASIPVSELWHASSYLGSEHVAYPVMLSFIYRWVGHSVLCAALVNAVFGAGTAPVAYWAAHELTQDRATSRFALWISAFFLYDVGWAMFLMRDTILLFLFSFSMAALISLLRRRSVSSLLLAMGSVALLGEFRFYSVHILIASAAVAAFLWVLPDKPAVRWTALIGCASAGTLAAGLVLIRWADWFQEHIAVVGDLLLKADAFQANDIFQLLVPSASVTYLRGLALGTLRYSFHPLAWVFWDIDWIGTVFYPGMYVIYFLLPFFVLGLWISLKRLQPLPVLFFAPLLFQALIQIHLYQGGDRQRMMVDVLFVVAAAIGWQNRREYQKAIRFIYIAFLSIVGAHLAWHFARYLL